MSNLLKDASILLTPTAYENGRMNATKPSKDLYGPELVTNGSFGTDSDWTKSSQSTISEGRANILSTDGSYQYIAQTTANYTSTQNKFVKITLDIVEINSGQLKAQFSGGTSYSLPALVGTHTIYVLNDGTTGTFNLARVSGATDITIDNVSVKEDLSGDFNFERNSAATRVNAQGLVENVQIISPELVSNGNFSQIGTEEVLNGNFSQEGSELITNGDFATDSDWNLGNGWSIGGGKANYDATSTGSELRQLMSSIAVGKTIKIQFDISDVAATKDAFF